ncbi:YadA-like family protein, partial [Pasteurellaceae bacterium 22721_9_1]
GRDENGNPAPVTINNIQSNLPDTYNKDAVNKNGEPVTKAQDLPDGVENKVTNAATVGDVLNAGFNVKENGEDRDFVKPYDTVNFVDGANTKHVVETNENGTVTNVSVNVVGMPVQFTDSEGNPVAKVGDKFYKVGIDGKPDLNSTPIDSADLTVNAVNPNAAPNDKGAPITIGNVNSGLKPYTQADAPDTKKAADGLVNLGGDKDAPDYVSDNNVATVGDLRNMGWVVSAKNNDYSNTVKNANEVQFVGEGSVRVEGKNEGDNLRKITVNVDMPVVYTNKAGDKVYKQVAEDGTVTFNTKPDGSGTPVDKGDVIASMNNGDNDTKTNPMQLSNVGGNLPNTYNQGDKKIVNADGSDAPTGGKPSENAEVAEGDETKSQSAPANKDEIFNNGATVGDVLNAGWNLKENTTEKDFVKPYDTVAFVDGKNTKANVTVTEGGKVSNVTFNVDKDLKDIETITLKQPKDGKDGQDGQDGQPGKDGVSAKLQIGEGPAGVDGKDGVDGLNGKDGKPQKPRIEYVYQNGDKEVVEKVATLNDGLKFVGNDGKEIVKKLNETLAVKGGIDSKVDPNDPNAKIPSVPVSDKNTYVENKDGELIVKIAENPDFNSLTIGTSDPNDNTKKVNPITIVSHPGDENKNTVTFAGRDENGNPAPVTINNIKSNLPDTYNKDAVNKNGEPVTKAQDLPNGVENKVTNVATVGDILNAGWNLQGNGTPVDFVKPYDTVNFANGTGTTVEVKADDEGKVSTVKVNVDLEKIVKEVTVINNGGWKATTGKDKEDFEQTDSNPPSVVAPGETVQFNSGKNLKVKQEQDGSTTKVTYALEDNVVLGSPSVPGKDGKPGKDGVDGYIGVNGKDGKSGVAINGKDGSIGAKGADGAAVAINGKDGSIGLQGPKGKDGKDGVGATLKIGEGPAGVDGKDGFPGIPGKDGVDGKPRIVYTPVDPATGKPAVDPKGNPVEEKVATLNDGLKFKGNDGKEVVKKLNETLTVRGGIENKGGKPAKPVSAKNTHVSNKDGELVVEIAETPEFKGVELNNGKGPSVNITNNKNGDLQVGGKGGKAVKITNVAPGRIAKDSKDAVNGSQLHQVAGDVANVNNKVNKLDKRVRGVGASAAAAASLPQVYIPGKSMVAAAAGTYGGASAVAVGYSRASDNGKLILKIQGTANSQGHVSGGVGMGYQW